MPRCLVGAVAALDRAIDDKESKVALIEREYPDEKLKENDYQSRKRRLAAVGQVFEKAWIASLKHLDELCKRVRRFQPHLDELGADSINTGGELSGRSGFRARTAFVSKLARLRAAPDPFSHKKRALASRKGHRPAPDTSAAAAPDAFPACRRHRNQSRRSFDAGQIVASVSFGTECEAYFPRPASLDPLRRIGKVSVRSYRPCRRPSPEQIQGPCERLVGLQCRQQGQSAALPNFFWFSGSRNN